MKKLEKKEKEEDTKKKNTKKNEGMQQICIEEVLMASMKTAISRSDCETARGSKQEDVAGNDQISQ